MPKTLIDLDEDALADAQRVLGTVTKKDTVNAALREVVRRRAASDFVGLAADGVFEPQPDQDRP
jgi:Arc/MetJ family transcription regulator